MNRMVTPGTITATLLAASFIWLVVAAMIFVPFLMEPATQRFIIPMGIMLLLFLINVIISIA